MAIDLKPLHWDWPPVTKGDTYPAFQITETEADSDLSRVRVFIKDTDGAALLTLDSNDSGVTINTATAGAWDFTVGPITADQTEALGSAFFSHEIETTDSAGTVRTEFAGSWQITE